MKTQFPKVDRQTLEQRANRHADQLMMDRFSDVSGAPIERQLVNMLRHECTNYDDNPTAARHQQACEAIAATYPDLAAECSRQVTQRHRQEQEAERALEDYKEQEEQERRARQQLVANSREAIGSLAVGQQVRAVVRGHERQAEIVNVGRSRVTIAFVLKDGRARQHTLHAALVEPIDV